MPMFRYRSSGVSRAMLSDFSSKGTAEASSAAISIYQRKSGATDPGNPGGIAPRTSGLSPQRGPVGPTRFRQKAGGGWRGSARLEPAVTRPDVSWISPVTSAAASDRRRNPNYQSPEKITPRLSMSTGPGRHPSRPARPAFSRSFPALIRGKKKGGPEDPPRNLSCVPAKPTSDSARRRGWPRPSGECLPSS